MDYSKFFLCSKPMDDPLGFCGRETEIKHCLQAIQKPGTHIIIYGSKGVGKTSLAEQLRLIADDTDDLIERYNLRAYWSNDNTFFTHYYLCDGSIDNTVNLLQSLMQQVISKTSLDIRELVEPSKIKSSEGIDSPFKTGIKIIDEKEYSLNLDFSNVIDLFYRCLQFVRSKLNVDKMLLIIDEIENISNKTLLAHVIRKCPDYITLAFIGIAENMDDLLRDHASVERQIALGTTFLTKMTDREMFDTISQTEKRFPGEIEISQELKERVVYFSRGLPWFAFLLLELSLRSFVEFNESSSSSSFWSLLKNGRYYEPIGLDIQHLDYAISKISDSSELELARRKIELLTKGDIKRLYILYILALKNDELIELSELREVFAKHKLNYSNILREMSRLNKSLLKIGRGKYKFHDLILRNYLRLAYNPNQFDVL